MSYVPEWSRVYREEDAFKILVKLGKLVAWEFVGSYEGSLEKLLEGRVVKVYFLEKSVVFCDYGSIEAGSEVIEKLSALKELGITVGGLWISEILLVDDGIFDRVGFVEVLEDRDNEDRLVRYPWNGLDRVRDVYSNCLKLEGVGTWSLLRSWKTPRCFVEGTNGYIRIVDDGVERVYQDGLLVAIGRLDRFERLLRCAGSYMNGRGVHSVTCWVGENHKVFVRDSRVEGEVDLLFL